MFMAWSKQNERTLIKTIRVYGSRAREKGCKSENEVKNLTQTKNSNVLNYAYRLGKVPTRNTVTT